MHQFYDKQYERRRPYVQQYYRQPSQRSRSRSNQRDHLITRKPPARLPDTGRQDTLLHKKNPYMLQPRGVDDYYVDNSLGGQTSINSRNRSYREQERDKQSCIRSAVHFNNIKKEMLRQNDSLDEEYHCKDQPPLKNQLHLKGEPLIESQDNLRCQKQAETDTVTNKSAALTSNTKQNHLRQQLYPEAVELQKLGGSVQSTSLDSLVIRRYPYQTFLEGIPQIGQNSRRKGNFA